MTEAKVDCVSKGVPMIVRNVIMVEARKTMHNRNEWSEFVRGFGCEPGPGNELYNGEIPQ